MTVPRAFRLGLLAWPVGRPASVAAFGARLDAWLDQARGKADLVVLPEYACVELGAALSGEDAPDEAAELRGIVAHAPDILAVMRDAARRAGLWLVPGTLPVAEGGRVVNIAPLIAPDGRMAAQQKRMMTRFEAERWGISPGAAPAVFETPWGKIGISICYDVEFPKHARMQVEAGAWVILAPSSTDSLHGFSRIRIGAQARALENQCYVAVAPTVGLAPWSAALDENHGQAAVFGPPDRGFPADGVVAASPMDTPGWVFATLDPALVEAVRRDGAVLNHRDFPRAPMPRCTPAEYR